MKRFIVCDLDDCLIKTDLLFQQWILLLKYKPALFFLSFLWLFKGKYYFKEKVSSSLSFSPDLVPYREEVINYLKKAKVQQDSSLILASASPQSWVSQVAEHLNIFDKAIGSTEGQNRKGSVKLQAIQSHTGPSEFTYLGDHPVDLKIWQHSNQIVAINPSSLLQDKIKKLNRPYEFIFDQHGKKFWRLAIKQIRVHQWVKNVLIFLPALASHQILQGTVLMNGLLAFAGFSLTASFVYVLNDLLDLQNDRAHQTKRNRPFASGDLHIKYGFSILAVLFLGATLISSQLPSSYGTVLALYLGLNLLYSLYLKQSMVVDIIILSMMYTLRIYAGSMATSIPVSEWLLSFSTLFFFSLACVKRYTEINKIKNDEAVKGRGYVATDRPVVMGIGIGSGLLSILVMLLYMQSKDVRTFYQRPELLWFILPILLFWISRVWMLANRDQVHDDPVVFAAKDQISWISLFALIIIMSLSI